MFHQKKNKMTVVTTKEQLKSALKRKDSDIKVQGDLAKKMKWMVRLSPAKVLTLAGAIAALPVAPAAPITAAAFTGTAGEIAGYSSLIIACGLSVSMILSIFRGYDIEAEMGESSIRLKSKK